MMKVLILLLCLGHCCVVIAAEAASGSHDLDWKIEKLELLQAKQVEESEQQKNTIEELQTQLCNMQQVNHHFQMQLDEQAQTIDKSQNERNQNSYVSFTATASERRDYDDGDQVVFDSIIRNYGESYYANNSTFICSHSAYYLFSTSVRSVGSSGMHAEIMVDNSRLVLAWATSDADDQWASNQAVTYCAAGHSVWVRCGHGQANRMYQFSSTFSGTLLRLA